VANLDGVWTSVQPRNKNRESNLDTRRKVKGGGGRGNRGEKSGTKGKFRKPDDDDTDNKRTIYGKLMYYHFRDGRWKPVNKNPAQIAADKKYAAKKASELTAAAALLTAGEATPAVAGMTSTPASTGAPDKDKLRAANLAKLVYEQLSIAMKAELEE
jgi:hypothetical protein